MLDDRDCCCPTLTTSQIVVAGYQVFIGILNIGKRDKCLHFLSS
jgi:hypothetical protein